MFSSNNYINGLKKDEYAFTGFPQKKSIEDYEEVYSRIRHLCSKNNKILSVYTFGEIKAPGISDIDLIFVLKDGAKLPGFLKRLSLDNGSRYVLLHPFFIVPREFMENISYIHPNSDYRLIYGEKINIKKIPKKELELVHEYLAADVILRHFPSDYLGVLLSGRINARLCLVRLNALHHSFQLFRGISGIRKKEWDLLAGDVKSLRERWFGLDAETSKKILFELLKRAVYASMDFVNEYKNFTGKNKNSPANELVFKGIQNKISFVRGWSAEKAISSMIAHYKRYRNFYSILPDALAPYLYAHSLGDGPLSSYISKRLSRKIKLNSPNAVLMKRVQLSNYQVKYAMKLRHPHFPCFFPLGFKNPRGIKNNIIYAYVLLKDSSVFRKAMHYILPKILISALSASLFIPSTSLLKSI